MPLIYLKPIEWFGDINGAGAGPGAIHTQGDLTVGYFAQP